ncbi:MAG: endonuclease/exonuclease/phosphatase, partial [Gammaproteobacteria bacterium]|nr:endonuclease/exonuclease/phosphatase [Gammaproteobacteria bacterium]
MINPCIRKSLTIALAIFAIFSISSCIAATTSISDIQGFASKSPLQEQTVSLSAIVTGDFQNNDKDTLSNLGGFYIQQEATDNDSSTSDGIFVFDGMKPNVDVSVGDAVELTGTVREFYGETQIKAISVKISGTGKIQPTKIMLPTKKLMSNSKGKKIADLEHYEGMLIQIPQKLTVSSLRYLEQFGEVNLVQGGLTQQFTNNNQPNSKAYTAHINALASRSIIFDDGMNSSNPSIFRHLNAGNQADYSIRVGDSISGVVGILRYSKGSGGRGTDGWRIEPTGDNIFNRENSKIEKPIVAGQLQVASFNVLNFFSTVDDGKAICNCRGADSALELKRQLDKTVTALKLMDSDIIGLIELENNADESIAMIVNALNARLDAAKYAYIDTGKINTDAIKTGFIYNSST